jgi:quercetin dioxygenase-like cupin family protein
MMKRASLICHNRRGRQEISTDDNYTYISELLKELEVPRDGILSRILLKDSQVNVTIFGFDAVQELSEHTAGSPAIVQILKGRPR